MLPIRCIELPCRNMAVNRVSQTGMGLGAWGITTGRPATANLDHPSARGITRIDHADDRGGLEHRCVNVLVVRDLPGRACERHGELLALLHLERGTPQR